MQNTRRTAQISTLPVYPSFTLVLVPMQDLRVHRGRALLEALETSLLPLATLDLTTSQASVRNTTTTTLLDGVSSSDNAHADAWANSMVETFRVTTEVCLGRFKTILKRLFPAPNVAV